MSLIKKANELNIQGKIKALVYGQAGMGKSTFALSSPKPLLFDFDNGVHRVNYNHLQGVDTVQIENYQNFVDVLEKEDLSGYETFVIDTGGKLLDYMGEHIISRNPKMGRANGMLTLQGYGERKATFSALIKRISIMNKHIVFVAHRQTTQEGDDMRYVPLFGGSNYDSLVTELDLVGYMEANGKERTITFDPTSRNDGKNTCNLPSVIKIPTILDANGNPTAPNNYMEQHVIKPYYERLEKRMVDGESYSQLVQELENQIDLITDEDSANDFISRIDEFEHIGNSKAVAGKMLSNKSKQLNLIFDKELGGYKKDATKKEVVKQQNSLV
jgi:hypothetical protein